MVFMVGYPIGLWDNVHNRPLIRRGITATDPRLDFEGRPEFVVDMASFPGSSGSPVIRPNAPGSSLLASGGHLMGVLYAGPMWSADGSIEVEQTPTQVGVSVRVPSHLGYILKGHLVKELLDEAISAAMDPADLRFNTEQPDK